jgi:hypothetical protein
VNEQLVVRGKTCHARRRLVRGVPLVENWSEKLPTSRELDVLPVTVLTRVLGPPRLNLGLHIVNGVRRLHLKRDYLAVKGGPNLGPRHTVKGRGKVQLGSFQIY